MAESKRVEHFIRDREKLAAAALGIDHAGSHTEEQLREALVHFLADVLHLADHKLHSEIDLEQAVAKAREVHKGERFQRVFSSHSNRRPGT